MPNLRHDAALRETARAIYDEVYPSDEWAPYSFEEAERYATVQYRQAISAAQRAKAVLAVPGVQLSLPVT